jgi:adenine deaminase
MIRSTRIRWEAGVITDVTDLGEPEPADGYLIPGFIDAHVHVESSLLTPAEFARMAVRHGTVAAVSDPHEMGNVLGVDGVRWMIDDAALTPFRILFGAPSCVPATVHETSGARLDAAEVAELLDTPGVGYLTEVMDYPGVLAGDPGVLAKIEAARRRGLPVDGHAPGLTGERARAYAATGITTDHECSTLAEAEDKIAAGMRILIREGSAARNFDALHPLISRHPGRTMLCTDDLVPQDLVAGHIDRLVARAVALGHDVFTVLEAACLTPREHYGLPRWRLREGDPFTAALLADLTGFQVRATWLDGVPAAADGATLLPRVTCAPVNVFGAVPAPAEALSVPAPAADAATARCRVIVAEDGQLLTGATTADLPVVDGRILPDAASDVAVLAIVNRYRPAPPAVAFIRGFGLARGALATSVAHDSHNVIGVGADADSLARAINAVVDQRGGFAVAGPAATSTFPLPVGGLMSDLDGDEVAARFEALTREARDSLGTPLRAPFMTLSFMALLVIPALKLSDLGLFDADAFAFTDVPCPA